MNSGSTIPPDTDPHELPVNVPPQFAVPRSSTGTVDDDDEREDEHDGENEASERETRDDTEAPEEFNRDDEDLVQPELRAVGPLPLRIDQHAGRHERLVRPAQRLRRSLDLHVQGRSHPKDIESVLADGMAPNSNSRHSVYCKP